MTFPFRYIITTILTFLVLSSFAQTEINNFKDSVQHKIQYARQIFWDSLPYPNGWINDFENLYSNEEKRSLDSVISIFNYDTKFEIAIVTIDTSLISKDSLENLTLHIANKWQVGEKDKNNGILVGISRGYRKMRIENGYGIETLISDNETKSIIDNYFIPEFKLGNYYQGTLNGLIQLINLLKTKLK